MTLHLKIESLFDIMPEMELLTEQHYQEITLYKDKVKLNPDWLLYKKLEEKAEKLLHCSIFSVEFGTVVLFCAN